MSRKKKKYVMIEESPIHFSKRESDLIEKSVMNALYQSLYQAGKLTEYQVKYLENSKFNFW